MPDPESTDNPEFKIVLGLIRDSLKKEPTKWTKYAKALQGAPPHLAGSQPEGPNKVAATSSVSLWLLLASRHGAGGGQCSL